MAIKFGLTPNLPRPPVSGDTAGLFKWADYLFQALYRSLVDLATAIGQAGTLDAYAVVDLPPATDHIRELVYVMNEAGGAVPAFSDGVNWRRVTDRAIVS